MPDQDMQKDELANSKQTIQYDDTVISYPSFKKAFWVVFFLIFFIQIIQAYYTIQIAFSNEVSPPLYLNIEIISITWYILSVIIIHYSITNQNLKPLFFYKIDWTILKKHLPQTLKYFAGTAVFVIMLSLISPETELQLEEQRTAIIVLMLLTATVIAPVCEELVFRGYLYSAMIPVFKREKERLVVNAMLFAAAHVFLIAFALGETVPYYIFILGYFIAKLYEDSRSVLPGIMLHLLNNSLVAIIDLIKLDAYNTSKLIQASF